MKIGNFYFNPHAIIAASMPPSKEHVTLYIMGMSHELTFGQGSAGYDEALAFVERQEGKHGNWKELDFSTLTNAPAEGAI